MPSWLTKLVACVTVSKVDRTCQQIQALLVHFEDQYPHVAKDIAVLLDTVRSST